MVNVCSHDFYCHGRITNGNRKPYDVIPVGAFIDLRVRNGKMYTTITSVRTFYDQPTMLGIDTCVSSEIDRKSYDVLYKPAGGKL